MKDECIRLRVEERLSLGEIRDRSGVAKSTLSGWLKDHPLTEEEKRIKNNLDQNRYHAPKKTRGKKSKFADFETHLNNGQKAKVAEAAVLFRLCLNGFVPFGSTFDGDKADWLVQIPSTGKILKIQVKWASVVKRGLPVIRLECANGHNKKQRYQYGDFDFIVGYDLYSDTAYVFSWEEVSGNKAMVTVKSESAEAWNKLEL